MKEWHEKDRKRMRNFSEDNLNILTFDHIKCYIYSKIKLNNKGKNFILFNLIQVWIERKNLVLPDQNYYDVIIF